MTDDLEKLWATLMIIFDGDTMYLTVCVLGLILLCIYVAVTYWDFFAAVWRVLFGDDDDEG